VTMSIKQSAVHIDFCVVSIFVWFPFLCFIGGASNRSGRVVGGESRSIELSWSSYKCGSFGTVKLLINALLWNYRLNLFEEKSAA